MREVLENFQGIPYLTQKVYLKFLLQPPPLSAIIDCPTSQSYLGYIFLNRHLHIS